MWRGGAQWSDVKSRSAEFADLDVQVELCQIFDGLR